MSVLVIAEHDNATLKGATLNTIAAAQKIGGDITVLVGGDEALFHSVEDLLAVIGNPVLYMGELGSAAVIKVITNMLAFIHLVAAGEALMLSKRAGLDLGVADFHLDRLGTES